MTTQLAKLGATCRDTESDLKRKPHSNVFYGAFLYELRSRLLQGALDELLDEQSCSPVYNANNPADQMLRLLSLEITKAQQQGLLSDILVTTFEARSSAMTEIQAACERLHNTPIPFSYMLLVYRTAYLFCFLSPFGLVASVGISAPFISA